jgi:hypothetical protein
MKTIAAFLCLAVAASFAGAETTSTVKPGDPKDAPLVVKSANTKDAPLVVVPADSSAALAKPTDAKTAPAKPVDPKAAAAKKEIKKDPPLPPIPGTVINRTNGTFLSLKLVSGNFVLSFYDKKHKLMAVDVTRATARWPNNRSALPKDYRTVLNGSGTSLVGQRPVLPPFNFPVTFNLLQGDGDDAKVVETYTVTFAG